MNRLWTSPTPRGAWASKLPIRAAAATLLLVSAGAAWSGELASKLGAAAGELALPVAYLAEPQELLRQVSRLADPRLASLAAQVPVLAPAVFRSAQASQVDLTRPVLFVGLDPRRGGLPLAYAASVRDPQAFLAGLGTARATKQGVTEVSPGPGAPPLFVAASGLEVLVSPDRDLALRAWGRSSAALPGLNGSGGLWLSVPAAELIELRGPLPELLHGWSGLGDLGPIEELARQVRRLHLDLELDAGQDLVLRAEVLPVRGSELARWINIGSPLAEDPLREALPAALQGLGLPKDRAASGVRVEGFVLELEARFPLGEVLEEREARRRRQREAQEHERLGLRLLGERRHAEAAEELSKAIELAPNRYPLHVNRGLAYLEAGRLEEAGADLSRAIELRPDQARPYWLRGGAFARQARFEEAVRDLSEAIRIEPGRAEHHASRGRALNGLKRHEEALRDFSKAVELEPQEWSFRHGLAWCLGELSRHEEAIAALSAGIDLDPHVAWLYRGRAGMHAAQKHYDLALADLDIALALEPRDSGLLQVRGWVHSRLHEPEAALADYDRALDLDPKDPRLFVARALLHYEQERHEAAIVDNTRAIELDPDNSVPLNNRALSLSKTGRFEEALADANRAIELDPQGGYYDTRGTVYCDRGLYEEALADYNKAIELEPRIGEVYYNRGRTYYKQGLLEQAEADFLKAVELDPSFADRPYAAEADGTRVAAGLASDPSGREERERTPAPASAAQEPAGTTP